MTEPTDDLPDLLADIARRTHYKEAKERLLNMVEILHGRIPALSWVLSLHARKLHDMATRPAKSRTPEDCAVLIRARNEMRRRAVERVRQPRSSR